MKLIQKRQLTKLQVQDFVNELLPQILKEGVICLTGNLGAGKTYFASQVISTLTGKKAEEITSPTFNIVNIYYTNEKKAIYHFDLYRIKNEEELENIGFFEAINEGLCIIEWPELAKNYLQNYLLFNILNLSKNKRIFELWQISTPKIYNY